MTFWRFLILASLCGVGYFFAHGRLPVLDNMVNSISGNLPFQAKRYQSGTLIPTAPLQRGTRKPAFDFGKYKIKPVATYALRGRVLATESYWFDRESNLSPLDIVVGWGPMSNQIFVDKISISQGLRHYSYHYDGAGVKVKTLTYNTANMHIIPANDGVSRTLKTISNGDIIALNGMLVNVQGEDSWLWRSSITRSDIGENSGEVMWVENISVITESYPSAE